MQLKKRLPLMMITLVCVPLLILALIIYVYSSRTLVMKSKDNIRQLAITEGRALEGLIQAKKYQVQILASDERVINVLETQWLRGSELYNGRVLKAENLLKETVNDEEDCSAIYVINSKGEVVASSDKEKNIQEVIDSKSFEKVLVGESVFENMVTNEDGEKYTIDMTVPIRSQVGAILGAVCKVVYNTSFSEFIKEIKINETGFAYILDSEATIIAHPNETKVGHLIEDKAVASMINTDVSLQTMEETTVETKEDGIRKYAAFYRVPDINWTIGICQNADEVQRQAVMEFVMIVTMTLVLIGLFVVASMRFSKKITEPIDKLVGVMKEVSKGKLDEYCDYEVDNEFGTLSKHYNNMIRSLSESRKEREQMLGELTITQDKLRRNIKALTENKEALSISEARYRATLDDIEETIWEYDTISGEILVTGKWKGFVERTNGVDGRNAVENIIEESCRDEFLNVLDQCKEGEILQFSKELVLQGLGKEVTWALCKGKAVRNAEGRIIKIRGIITDITSHKLREEKVRRLAYFDVLTGCLNKQTFMEQLRIQLEEMKKGQNVALFFVDLDDFKKINDTMGHDIGDKLLNYVARYVKGLLPIGTFISRFGGDEFVICKTIIGGLDEVEDMARNILEVFKGKIVIDPHVIHITCSIGIALYPLDGMSCEELLKNADTAMYKAKEQGKNNYSFYAEDMSKVLARKLTVESALREAVSDGENLYLQYQPIVETRTGRTVGAEALVRLKTNILGFVSPGEFIPVAEESGLIVEVGDWVMENALRTLKYYRERGCSDFSISINVSAIQVREKDFMEKLKGFVKKINIPTQCIKLEVTETVLMQNLEESKKIFDEVKEMGIKLALDDFGTGYSSLNYLRNIPLDVLKIDKSFIDEITVSRELSEIVDSIINMAHILGISVVAEGVESEEQLELLRQKGCDLIQGYVFSRPLMEEELGIRLLEEKIS